MNHSGGGMALDGENHLIVGIGDHNCDGIYNVPAPRDDVSSYGKIVRINLTALESGQLVKGLEAHKEYCSIAIKTFGLPIRVPSEATSSILSKPMPTTASHC